MIAKLIFRLMWLGLLSVTCSIIGLGQDIPSSKVSIASPTAASLGKYADFPVSYHTGLPNIDIPIYTIKSGPLQLPVSLSYHAGGLKVMDLASPVGAGWALNAGGVITRTVRGGPDDRGILAAHTQYGHYHDYGYNSYLFLPSETTCGSPPCPVGSLNPANDQGILNTVRDGEPDLYFFNFGGFTGKFYFNDDRTPVLVPQQDLKIEPILADESGGPAYIFMLGFVVTTSDGTKYYFGKNQNQDGNIDAIEVTTSINPQTLTITNQTEVSSWFLTKIESADAQFSITLTYLPERSSHYTLSMFPVWNFDESTNFKNNYGNHEYNLVKNFVNGVRLNQILFADGNITFNPGIVRNDLGDYNSMVIADVANTEARSLGSIDISNDNGFCKRFELSQSYFSDQVAPLNGYYPTSYPVLANIQSDKYRLRLDRIQEKTCDSSITIPPYKFDYYTERVPRRLTFGQDHWGFSNGVVSNETLVPSYLENSVPIPGANREAAWPAMRGGALEKITYPTGGSTQFDYEPHDTYGTLTTFTSDQVMSLSMGYDGGSNFTTSYTFSGNLYHLELSNANTEPTGNCNLLLINSSNVIVKNFGANPGSSEQYDFTVPAGNYTIQMSMNRPMTGHGAFAAFTEWLPVTTVGNIMVGGLRIKTVTSNDGVTPTNNVTNYTYTTGGTNSSGILYSRPVYVSLLRNDIVKLIGAGPTNASCSQNGCSACDASTLLPYYKSAGGIFPMETVQGNHIGYEEVKVAQNGNGYSIYRYYGSNIWENINGDIVTRTINTTTCNQNVPNFPTKPMSFEFKRGDLKYEGHFKEGGGAIKEVYYYPEYATDAITTPGYIVVNLGSASQLLWGTEYELQTHRKTKIETITYQTDPETGIYMTDTMKVYFESAFHNQPTRKVRYNSKGDNLIELTKYAADFRIAACDNISDGWSDYINVYNTATNTFSTSLNCSNPTWNCRWIAYQQWRFDKSVARISYVNYRKTNFTNATNTYKTCMTNAKDAADASLQPVLELRNIYDNPPVEMTNWKNDELLSASFNIFEFSAGPSPKVYPGKLQMIYLNKPATTFSASVVNGSSISKDSRYVDKAITKFELGHPIEVSENNDFTTSYLWDYKNEFPIAKISNAYKADISYTSFEAEGNGNWNITSTARVTDGITGNKCYEVSNGISRSNLNASTEYILTYWAKSNNAYMVDGTQGNAIQGRSFGDWKFYMHRITGVTEASIEGAGLIDELRLYPAGAQMTTYTYDPLIGMTSQCDVSNKIIYYEYDDIGRLKLIRDQDKNIVKKFDYQYHIPVHANPIWTVTGNTRCKPCPANNIYFTNTAQNEEKDTNPNSPTYNQLRWTDAGTSSSCVVNPDWQYTTTAIRCRQVNGVNTGEQEREQQDMNPCSPTWNQLRWVVTGTSPLCSVLINCVNPTCALQGPDWACINNICEQGIKVYHDSIHVGSSWVCYYHYEFSDGSWSMEFQESSPVDCTL